MDIPNYKFGEVLNIFEDTWDTLRDQTSMADAYENLTKMVNMSFQKVFDKFGDMKDLLELATKFKPSVARGGEERKSKSDFMLRDETSEDEYFWC